MRERGGRQAGRAGDIPPLIALLRSPVEVVQKNSAGALFHLIRHAASAAKSVAATGIPSLKALLASPSCGVLVHAASALGKLQ